MLLAYLCSLDEGIKKHGPEALELMKIKLQGLQNPFQKQLKSDTASEKAFEPQFFQKLWFFNEFLLPKRTQNRRTNVEHAMFKNNTFWNIFFLEFSSLWLPKIERKFVVFWIFVEKPDFVKIIAFPIENCYFSGFELSNMNQISM